MWSDAHADVFSYVYTISTLTLPTGVLAAFYPMTATGTSTTHAYQFLTTNFIGATVGTFVAILYKLVRIPCWCVYIYAS